jgi:hypothetical protein
MRLSLACDRVCNKFDSDSQRIRLRRDDDIGAVVKPNIEQGYNLSPYNVVVAEDVTSDRCELGKVVSETKLTDIGGRNRNPAIRDPPPTLAIRIPDADRHPTIGYYQLAGKSGVHKSPATTLFAAYPDLNRYVRESGAG